MLGLAAVPSIIMFFGCLILPESPRWLVSKGYDDQAFKVLKKLRGSADVASELRAMQEVCEETASAENSNNFFSKLCLFVCFFSVFILFKGVYILFSNSLIIHEEKTKEITTVKEVWICDPNYHKIW